MSAIPGPMTADPHRRWRTPPGLGPDRGRTPGLVCAATDPGILRRLSYVTRAWDLARGRFADEAIVRHVGSDFHEIVRGMVGGLLMAVSLVGATTAVGAGLGGVAGAFFGGIGAAPGAAAGARIGLAVGMELLEWLGVAFLLGYVAGHLGAVGEAFRRGIGHAWDSCGASAAIEAAAREMAEGIGIFFSLLLQALVAYLAKEMGGAARGRIGPALAKLRETRLFKHCPGLEAFLTRHFDELRARYSAEAVEDGAPRVRPDAPLPDISNEFDFRTFERDGKTYQQASGRLGVPGRVQTHRDTIAQRGVSAGTGDDAGHLIGNRFGAPGGPENLSQQNWIANRYGTYKGLEDYWADQLKAGVEVEVKVTDVTRAGEDRPFMREVTWTETAPDGQVRTDRLTFANTHTPKSRGAQQVPPTVSEPQSDNVIHYDFENQRRLP